jgi:purine-cytosine permease-like protein
MSLSTDLLKYCWIPQSIVLLILAGAAGPKFNIHSQSTGDPATIVGNRLSFFSICLSSAITYAPCSADFLVYCDPKIATRWKVFWGVLIGLTLSFIFTFTIGTGLASGLQNDPIWEAAGTGTGALVVAGFDSLGGFGKVCAGIAALGLIANMVPPIYSTGVDFQILGRYPAMVPRFVWNSFGVVIFTVCGLVGRNDLSQIFTNFLALMGYCKPSVVGQGRGYILTCTSSGVVLWIAITVEEQFIMRRGRRTKFIWSDWDNQAKLHIGLAATAAFCVGWVGAVLCMAQYYYTGPLGRLIGVNGGDMGNYVGFAWAGLVYPPLRYWELKKFGR